MPMGHSVNRRWILRFGRAAFFFVAFSSGVLLHLGGVGVHAFSDGPGSCDAGIPLQGSHLLNEQLGGGPLSDNGFQVRINGAVLDSESTNELAVTTTDDDSSHDLELVASRDGTFFRGFLIRIDGENVDTRDYLDVPEGETNAQVVSICILIEEVGGVAHTNNSAKTEVSALLRLSEPSTDLAMDVTMVVQNRDGNAEWYNSRYVIDAVEGLETMSPMPATNAPTVSPAPSPVPTTSPMPSVSPIPTSIIVNPTQSPGTSFPSANDVDTTSPSTRPDDSPSADNEPTSGANNLLALPSTLSALSAVLVVAITWA